MTVRRARPRAWSLFLACLVAVVATPPARPAAAQEPGRRLSVEPANALENQVVEVRWSGFDPLYEVTVYQCKGTAPRSLADCYTEEQPPVTEFGTAELHAITAEDGTGSTPLEVRPAPQLPVLGCSSTSPCSVLAFENDGEPIPPDGLPGTAVSAPLQFAPGPADCPKVDRPDVVTAGEGSAAHALYAWSARVCNGASPLALDYTESSSPEGREGFLGDEIDVGITSMAPTPEETAGGSKRAFAAAPIDLTGVVVAFNVTDAVTRERITEMNLTPRLVAIMIAGGDSSGPGRALFTDPEFVALNPGHNWPAGTANPLLRAERNADTVLLTSWLDTDRAARAYLDGNDPTATVDRFWEDIDYPTDIFESRDPTILGAYNPLSGTLTNARRLLNFLPPGDGTLSPGNDGLLGVMDVVTARKFGFPTARLRPANAPEGSGFVAPDGAGLLAGFAAMKITAGSTIRVPDPAAPGAYPLAKVDYALVPTSGTTVAKAGKIAQFLEFARTGGQAAGVLSDGYVPLPDALRAKAEAAQKAVVAGGSDGPSPAAPPPPGGEGGAPPNTGPEGAPLGGAGPDGGGSVTPDGSSSFGDFATGGGDVSGTFDAGSTFGDTSFSTSDPTAGVLAASTAGAEAGLAAAGGSGAAAGTTAGTRAATLRPLGRFAGGEAHRVLPVLLGIGLVALVAGPGLGLSARRRSRARPPTAATPPMEAPARAAVEAPA